MAATVHKRARANRDLVEHYVYLAEAAGMETAERFLSSAEKSFGDLAQHPGMGARLALRSPKLAGLRKWPVSGFDNNAGFLFTARGRGLDRACAAWRARLAEAFGNRMRTIWVWRSKAGRPVSAARANLDPG
jgi:toxin ParE1/3/4